jgi:hypothetical protein
MVLVLEIQEDLWPAMIRVLKKRSSSAVSSKEVYLLTIEKMYLSATRWLATCSFLFVLVLKAWAVGKQTVLDFILVFPSIRTGLWRRLVRHLCRKYKEELPS